MTACAQRKTSPSSATTTPRPRTLLHHQDQRQGLGLGLAICDNLISALGGELALANHPQGGALLSLYLQRAAGGTSAQSVEDSPL